MEALIALPPIYRSGCAQVLPIEAAWSILRAITGALETSEARLGHRPGGQLAVRLTLDTSPSMRPASQRPDP